jgi:hypothetical protein
MWIPKDRIVSIIVGCDKSVHYVYDVPVLPANTASNHVQQSIKLGAGIIRHVTIIFPPGCVRLVRCTLWNKSVQVLPTNPEATYGAESYVVEADCYVSTEEYGNQFYFLAWTEGSAYAHTLTVMLDVQGVDEPDMGSAVKTLYKIVDQLVTVLRGWY